jgi:hypothetical protein
LLAPSRSSSLVSSSRLPNPLAVVRWKRAGLDARVKRDHWNELGERERSWSPFDNSSLEETNGVAPICVPFSKSRRSNSSSYQPSPQIRLRPSLFSLQSYSSKRSSASAVFPVPLAAPPIAGLDRFEWLLTPNDVADFVQTGGRVDDLSDLALASSSTNRLIDSAYLPRRVGQAGTMPSVDEVLDGGASSSQGKRRASTGSGSSFGSPSPTSERSMPFPSTHSPTSSHCHHHRHQHSIPYSPPKHRFLSSQTTSVPSSFIERSQSLEHPAGDPSSTLFLSRTPLLATAGPRILARDFAKSNGDAPHPPVVSSFGTDEQRRHSLAESPASSLRRPNGYRPFAGQAAFRKGGGVPQLSTRVTSPHYTPSSASQSVVTTRANTPTNPALPSLPTPAENPSRPNRKRRFSDQPPFSTLPNTVNGNYPPSHGHSHSHHRLDHLTNPLHHLLARSRTPRMTKENSLSGDEALSTRAGWRPSTASGSEVESIDRQSRPHPDHRRLLSRGRVGVNAVAMDRQALSQQPFHPSRFRPTRRKNHSIAGLPTASELSATRTVATMPCDSDADLGDSAEPDGRRRRVVERLGRRAGSGLHWLRGDDRPEKAVEKDARAGDVHLEDIAQTGDEDGSGMEELAGEGPVPRGDLWAEDDDEGDIFGVETELWELYRSKTWEEQREEENKWKERVE